MEYMIREISCRLLFVIDNRFSI